MKVQRPLVVLDLETTGTWVEKDRIIEIAMIKLLPDGSRETYHKKINPDMLIPPVVVELTGISNEDVKDAPFFKDVAPDVLAFIGQADIGGFNVARFDLPLLERELRDAAQPFLSEDHKVFDAQKVFHLNQKRDLTAAYDFYCHKELEGAHSAMVDTEATLAVMEAQVVKYGEGKEDVDVLGEFEYEEREEFYDSDRRFRWWDGELYMMFGKYARKDTLKAIAKKDPGYLEWMLSKDFSEEVKVLVEDALKGQFPKYQSLSN